MKRTKSSEKIKAEQLVTSHTNRLLVSTSIAFVSLVALLLINRGQGYSHTILQTQAVVSVLCALSVIAAVGLTVWAVVKKETYLIEYIAITFILAVCLYCLHGVGFVTIKVAKYITAVILIVYLVASFIYHTIAPKISK